MRATFERKPVPANPRLGIIGGGQLAKMTAQAAQQLGCEVVILERSPDSPAAQITAHSLVGDWDDPQVLLQLAAQVDAVTLENEFVSVEALAAVEAEGHRLHPGTATLRRMQDKLIQKQTLTAAGLPVPAFAAVDQPEELAWFAGTHGWPLVLKARRNGYDGKGNYTVRSADEAVTAWQALGGGRVGLYVEAFCPYVNELAVIITRGEEGAVAAYPVVETVQQNHICHLVRAPAPVPAEVADRAGTLARQAIEAVAGVGSFGVEMFLTRTGEIFINELAPRVHNSGHYTIEATRCSQFENHVRAVMGWPLGAAELPAPAAMVNLLGAGPGPGAPAGLSRALAVPGAHVHVYGKRRSGTGRKMGHVTARGRTLAEAEATAGQAAQCLQFGETV